MPQPDARARFAPFAPFVCGFVFLAVMFPIERVVATLSEAMDPCFSGTSGDLCYCERFAPTGVLQPANASSSLALAFVGLAVLLDAGLARRGSENPLRAGRFYPIWYAVLAIHLGVSSAIFHASYTYWAGILDSTAMYFWLGFVLVYNVVRLFGLGRASAFGAWLALCGSMTALRILLPNEGSAISTSTFLFASLVVATLLTTLVTIVKTGEHRRVRSQTWLVAALLAFGAGLSIWLRSGTGEPLCSPTTALQGHALWHVLSAASVAALYLYLRGSAPGLAACPASLALDRAEP